MAKFLSGKLVGIKEGEYQGTPQYTAQVLEQWENGSRVEDVQLAEGEIEGIRPLMDKPVVLQFVQRHGAKNGRAWLLNFGGRLNQKAA